MNRKRSLKLQRTRNRRYRERLRLRGLTCRLKPRKQRIWPWPLKGDNTAQKRVVRTEHIARGLTGAGTVRRNKRWALGSLRGSERGQLRRILYQRERRARMVLTDLGRQWREFRAAMAPLPQGFLSTLERNEL